MNTELNFQIYKKKGGWGGNNGTERENGVVEERERKRLSLVLVPASCREREREWRRTPESRSE